VGGDSPPPVLLVEDDENDVFFLRLAWEEERITNPLIACTDGADAIDYFCGGGRFERWPEHMLPCLLLTDLKMPKIDGFGLLKWLKEHAEFGDFPKIALSSSNEEQDRDRVFALGASEYLIKPLTVAERGDLVRLLATRWLRDAHATHEREHHQ
jgi:CheY-like chemotaxis protein